MFNFLKVLSTLREQNTDYSILDTSLQEIPGALRDATETCSEKLNDERFSALSLVPYYFSAACSNSSEQLFLKILKILNSPLPLFYFLLCSFDLFYILYLSLSFIFLPIFSVAFVSFFFSFSLFLVSLVLFLIFSSFLGFPFLSSVEFLTNSLVCFVLPYFG